MKKVIGALLVPMLLCGAASAQTVPQACLADERDFDVLLASLKAEGWAPIAPGAALPADVVERLALARMIFYASTDRGGSTLPEIMALQRRTVPGLARRVDTDLARQRVLTRDAAAMTFNWSMPQQGGPDIVEILCRIASPEGVAASGTDEGFGPSSIETLDGEPLRRRMIVPLEPDVLSDLTTDTSTVAIVETVSVINPDADR